MRTPATILSTEPQRGILLHADGTELAGTYRDGPATFVADAKPGTVFAVYWVDGAGRYRIRRELYPAALQ